MPIHPSRRRIAAVLPLLVLTAACPAGERDLAALFTPEHYLDHVKFLADDARAGRLPGTPGITAAETYIVEHFQQLGLKPGGENGTWFQEFEVNQAKTLEPEHAHLKIAGIDREFRYGEDFVTMPFSKPGTLQGPLAFAGYGVEAEEHGYNDYRGFDPRGKVLLIIRHEPLDADPDASFGGTQPSANALFVRKARIAAERGALGLLVVNAPTRDRDDSLYPWADDESRNSYDLPMLHVTTPLADALLAAAHMPPLADLAKDLDEERETLSTDLKGLEADVDTGVSWATARNIIAVLPGTDRADEYIVVGAHHDHVGVGRDWRGGGGAGDAHQIHNGADDNASGTAAVLELARAFALGPPPSRSMIFMTFSAEEMGMVGSEHYVNHPTVPLASIRAMFNFDMVGRLNTGKGKLYGTGSAQQFDEIVARANANLAAPVTFPRSIEGIFNQSDHISFFKKDIPVLWAFTDVHNEYHRPPDDWELIDADGGAQICRLAYNILGELVSMREGPHWQAPASQPTSDSSDGDRQARRRPRVRLGIMPDFDNDANGLRIATVESGGAAASAGIKEGDVILRIGERDIRTMSDYMEAARGLQPGDKAIVKLRRADKELDLEVTFQGRGDPDQNEKK